MLANPRRCAWVGLQADAADTDAAVGPASQLAEKSAAAAVPKVAVTGGDAGDKGTEGLRGKAGDEGNEGDEDEGEEEEDIDAALYVSFSTWFLPSWLIWAMLARPFVHTQTVRLSLGLA